MLNVNPPAPRVLVVDDDSSVRRFAVRALERAGYDVLSAADGVAALQLVAEHPAFDLFVIDMSMPQMSGEELARQLRTQNPDIKVLYFTGYSDRLFDEKRTLWGHEAFVEKPVSTTGFLEAASLLLFGHTHGPQRDRPLAATTQQAR